MYKLPRGAPRKKYIYIRVNTSASSNIHVFSTLGLLMNLHVCSVSILFSNESLFSYIKPSFEERETEFEFKNILKIQGSK